jgi:hypothetical protein
MRKIDSKFHIENDEIIKTSNNSVVSKDEPLFLVRARDYLALNLLRYYAKISGADSCNDYHMHGLSKTIEEFEEFKIKNPEKMKQPGVTRGL